MQCQWQFFSAPLCPDKAVFDASGGVPSISLPSRRACAWCEREFAVAPGKGARIRASVEIALGEGESHPFNDVMLFVTFYDRRKGNRKGVPFIRRDFVRYLDAPLAREAAAGVPPRLSRTFDETFAVPEACDAIRVDFIAKWHVLEARLGAFAVEETAAPPRRRVRCVVGNPHERKATDWRNEGTATAVAGWGDPDAVVASRLTQLEDCLRRIFAEVDHPDIVLFSEMFTDTGTPCPERTSEAIPGGPTFALASRYAAANRCHIAMNVHERTPEGAFHNSTFICGRGGELRGLYRKVTLTSGEYMAGILPGDEFKVFDLDFGRVGCVTCWDNWFSESAKYTRRLGAELLLFPLAGCAPDHVETVFPARAIDTGVPTLVAMRQGHLPSGIIDRDGTWIAKTFEDGGYAWTDVDLAERKRTFWLSVGPGEGDPYGLYLDESRPELYARQDMTRPRR